MRERVRAAAGGLGLGLLCFFIYRVHIFFCACIYFFCAFLKHRQNKLSFSVSSDFFPCVYCHPQKNHTIILWVFVFFCRDILKPTCFPKKTHRKIHHP